jgi:hypothetical protein
MGTPPNRPPVDEESFQRARKEFGERIKRERDEKEARQMKLWRHNPYGILGVLVLGIALGLGYVSLGIYCILDNDPDPKGTFFLDGFLYIPGILFSMWGPGWDRYATKFDDTCVTAMLMTLSAEIFLFIVMVIFNLGFMKVIKWVPDLILFCMMALACWRRVRIWAKVFYEIMLERAEGVFPTDD